MPTDNQLYTQLAEEFPENLVPYTYVSPTPAPTVETPEGEEEPQEGLAEDSDLLYLRKLGYDLQADEEQTAAIRARKNEIIEEYIQAYITNNESTEVYLNYMPGNISLVSKESDLKTGTRHGFFDSANGATYTLGADLDFTGLEFAMAENFTGTLDGAGHTVTGLKITISTSRREFATEKSGAIFGTLNGATIRDITFKDTEIVITTPANIAIDAAVLALEAIDSTIENVTFDGVTITTGRGDDGSAPYRISDSILTNSGSTITDLKGANVVIEASENVEVIETLEPMN